MRHARALGLALGLGLLGCGGGSGQEAPPPPPPPPAAPWQPSTPFPGGALHGATSFTLGGRAHVGTGETGWNDAQTATAAFWDFDPATGAWSRMPDYGGGAVVEALGLTLGNRGYVGFGYAAGLVARTDLWSYDPSTRSWAQAKPFPGPSRIRPMGVAVGGKGYVLGGISIEGEQRTPRWDLWAYDPQTDAWTRKRDFPGESPQDFIWGAARFAIGTTFYVGCGENDGQQRFWAYDTLTDTWTRKAPFPGARRTAGVSTSLNGRGFLGLGQAFATGEDLRDLWSYDPATDRWSPVTPLPASAPGRWDAVAFTLGQDLYVGLGRTDTLSPTGRRSLADVWRIVNP